MENKTEEKKELSEADQKIADAEALLAKASEGLADQAKEMGYDIDVDEGFNAKPPPPPKARLTRRATVGDSIRAERLARMHYDLKKDEDVLDEQTIVAKLSLLMKFDGKHWPIPDIEALDSAFFTHIVVKFVKFLT